MKKVQILLRKIPFYFGEFRFGIREPKKTKKVAQNRARSVLQAAHVGLCRGGHISPRGGRVYAVCRLSQQGIDVRPWKRAYIEMAEGVTAICSMSQLHFGTRFPLYFDNRPVPNDLWHLRLHMYVGSKLRPRLEGETGALLDQVQDSTVDIYDHREDSDWISAAQHCYGLAGIEY